MDARRGADAHLGRPSPGRVIRSDSREWVARLSPREIAHASAPPIRAVLFTHEHDDHFQIASLARIDRNVRVLISSRSSPAVQRAAELMGFATTPVETETTLRFGELELRTFAPDLLHGDTMDEWDVIPFAVRDLEHRGTFLSTVDIPPHRSSSSSLRDEDAAGVVALANNLTCRYALTNWMPPTRGLLSLLPSLTQALAAAAAAGGPSTFLLSGGGWSFSGPLEWLNRCFFPVDNWKVAEAMRGLAVHTPSSILAPLPGETVLLEGKRCVGIERRHEAFIQCKPQSAWPGRRYESDTPRAVRVEPLHRGVVFGDREAAVLTARLDGFGRWLLGSRLYLALNSLTKKDLKGRRRAYALRLQTHETGDGWLLEYEPSKAAFVSGRHELQDYAAGAMCWASDLLSVLEGQVPAATFLMGHVVEFVHCDTPRPVDFSLPIQLCLYAHPLRMSERHFELYKGLSRRYCEGAFVPSAEQGS